MQDLLGYTGAATGVLAVLGTMLTKWLDAKVKEEARLRGQLLGRIQDLETRLSDSVTKVAELELKIMSKTFEMRELEIKYEALMINHGELAERYRVSEDTSRKLMERLISFTGETIRRQTPAEFPKPQFHHKPPGEHK